jgi:outer membrane autotransporter protein
MFSLGRFIRYGVALAFVVIIATSAWTGDVYAQSSSCTDTNGYSYAQCSGNGNSSGTTVTSGALVATAAATTVGLVSSRVSQFRQGSGSSRAGIQSQSLFATGNGTGASAGENMDTRMGAWGNLAYLRTEGDKTGANFESDLMSGMIGFDYRLGSIDNPTFIGLGLGYETADITTSFNRGGIDTTGMTIAPYVSFGLTKVFSIDVVGGYTMLSYDTTRRDPISSANITGSFDAERLFGAADLVGGWSLNKWNLGGRVGMSYVTEEQDAYRESNGVAHNQADIDIGAANTGVRLGYSFDRVEPYIGGNYSYNVSQSGEGVYDGRNTLGGSVGLNFAVMPNFSVNVEGRAGAREDISNYGGSATLRLNF